VKKSSRPGMLYEDQQCPYYRPLCAIAQALVRRQRIFGRIGRSERTVSDAVSASRWNDFCWCRTGYSEVATARASAFSFFFRENLGCAFSGVSKRSSSASTPWNCRYSRRPCSVIL
jgi:hypothetical protein